MVNQRMNDLKEQIKFEVRNEKFKEVKFDKKNNVMWSTFWFNRSCVLKEKNGMIKAKIDTNARKNIITILLAIATMLIGGLILGPIGFFASPLVGGIIQGMTATKLNNDLEAQVKAIVETHNSQYDAVAK